MAIPSLKGLTKYESAVAEASYVLTKPTAGGAPAVDDLLVIIIANEDNTASTTFNALTGWTKLGEVGDATPDVKFAVYYRVCTGSESSTETITVATGVDYGVGFYCVFEGVDTSASPMVQQGTWQQVGSATSDIASGLTTGADNMLAVAIAAYDGADGGTMGVSGTGWPSSFGTDQYGESAGIAAGVSAGFVLKDMASIGATQDVTFTSSLADGWVVGQIAIQGLAIPPAFEMVAGAATEGTTTSRLTGFSGTFGGGRLSETVNPSATTTDVASDGYREDVWSIQATADAITSGVYEFRVLYGGVVADTITQTPQVTIGGGATELVIQDASHSHNVDGMNLNVAVLINEASHNHVVDNLSLNVNTIIQEAIHSHAVDNIDLSFEVQLIVNDASHGHTVDNMALIQFHTLSIAESLHGHTVDGNLNIDTNAVLSIAESLHSNSVDNMTLVQNYVLAMSDAGHSHAVDNLALAQIHDLIIQEAFHGHTVDNLTLASLTINDALHAHNVDNLTLTQIHELNIISCVHAHFVDSILLIASNNQWTDQNIETPVWSNQSRPSGSWDDKTQNTNPWTIQ